MIRLIIVSAIVLNALALSGCYTVVALPDKKPVITSVARLETPVDTFDQCSPYSHLNFLDIEKVEKEVVRKALQNAIALAQEGKVNLASDKASFQATAAWKDGTALMAIMIILGAKLDGAHWTVQTQWGPLYKQLCLRLVELSPDDPMVQLYWAMLLLKSPPTMGGDAAKGAEILQRLRNTDLKDDPAVLYGLWFANKAADDPEQAISWCDQYMAICSQRGDINAWRSQFGDDGGKT